MSSEAESMQKMYLHNGHIFFDQNKTDGPVFWKLPNCEECRFCL